MNNEEYKSQDEQDVNERAHDVKREKRNHPDDRKKSGENKESVAHDSPQHGCYHDSRGPFMSADLATKAYRAGARVRSRENKDQREQHGNYETDGNQQVPSAANQQVPANDRASESGCARRSFIGGFQPVTRPGYSSANENAEERIEIVPTVQPSFRWSAYGCNFIFP